jgi:hypothetical protein
MKDPVFIQQMIQRLNEAGERVRQGFSNLSLNQLNWKPDSKSWSIGQCLDHLVISDCSYFPVFKRIISRQYDMSRWERWSPLSGFFGKMLASQLQEKAVKKLNAPAIFTPVESDIDLGILERFYKHLDTLRDCMLGCQPFDLDKTHITSPVAKFVTYNLRHSFTILVQHEHRHINQAIRVKEAKQFPV